MGNYLALAAGTRLNWYADRFGTAGATIEARWGAPRRIGQWGFFDGSAGVGVGQEYAGPVRPIISLNARIGLAH